MNRFILLLFVTGCAAPSRTPVQSANPYPTPASPYVVLEKSVDVRLLTFARAAGVRGTGRILINRTRIAPDIVVPTASSLSPAETDSVVAILRSSVRADQPVLNSVIAFSVADSVKLEVVEPVVTMPRFRNASAVQKEFQSQLSSLRIREGKLRVMFKVEPNGLVQEVRIREQSGNALLDQVAKHLAKTAVFDPCRTDGIATPCWVALDFVAMVR